MTTVEPPAEALAEPESDPDSIDREYVRDELAWLEGSREAAEDWLARHSLALGFERVTAFWGDRDV